MDGLVWGGGALEGESVPRVSLGCSLTLSHSLIHLLSGQLCDNWPHNIREYLQLLLRKGMQGVGQVHLSPEMEPARGSRWWGTGGGDWHLGPEQRGTVGPHLRVWRSCRALGEVCIYLVPKHPAAQDLPVDNAIFMENIWTTEMEDWARRPGHLLASGHLQSSPLITCSKGFHHRLVGRTARGIGPVTQVVTVDDICAQALQPLSY